MLQAFLSDSSWDNVDYSTLAVTVGRPVWFSVLLRDIWGNLGEYASVNITAVDVTSGATLAMTTLPGHGRNVTVT